MKNLNGAGRRLLDAVRQFTVAQRTLAIIGVAVLALGGIALSAFVAHPTYSPLFTGLSASDASGVVAQLQKDKVDYQLSDGGATILVPADKVDAERIAAASAGLPSSSTTGYALLDTLGVTSSEFQQDVTYKRAIEGELAKTIESISGVASASVQLAIPKQSVFSSDTQNPTASVFVNVSEPLTSDQVQAIVHLTSASYPGLKDANVSVVDQKGDTLSAIGGGTSGSGQQASDYEARTRTAVQAMLDQLLGPGNSTVTVSADISQSTGTQSSKSYTVPSGSPASSESTNQTTYGNGASGSGTNCGTSGVLGTDTTNSTAASCGTSTTTGSTKTSGGNGYVQSQVTKDNLVDETDTTKTITAGTLNRQTIAVAVNSAAVNVSALTIQNLVQAAAGYNAARGDTVSVASVSFSKAAAQSAQAALAQANTAQSAANMTKIITTAIWVVGGLALFVILLVVGRKLFKRPEGGPLAGGPVDGGAFATVPGGTVIATSDHQSLAVVPPAGMVAGVPGAMPLTGNPYAANPYASAPTVQLPPMQAAALPADASPFSRLQADVDALAGADPERTADYLRALMAEGSRA